jgi:hypothetical protein
VDIGLFIFILERSIFGLVMLDIYQVRKEAIKMNAKYKAELVYYTGETIVEKEHAPAVMKELEVYNGTFYADIEMNGLILIQRA